MTIEIENGLYESDVSLMPYKTDIIRRHDKFVALLNAIKKSEGIENFTKSYERFGLHVLPDNSIVGLEWVPDAEAVFLRGDFNEWMRTDFPYKKLDHGKWEINIPPNSDGSCRIRHNTKIKLAILGKETGQLFDRISPWAHYVCQEKDTPSYDWHFYNPPIRYEPKFDRPRKVRSCRIYEAHVGISSDKEGITSYAHFTNDVLPRIAKNGYNVIQLMAIQEHAYYASFGYQVTSFFASSSRYGTPEELRELIDTAHKYGIQVLLDIVHSHASSNVLDGLNNFDGTEGMAFWKFPFSVLCMQ